MDDPLGDLVARSGLCAKEERPGLGDAVGIILELLIEGDDMQDVQQLPLVLMEPLGLDVKNRVGVQNHAPALLCVGHERHLVLMLDLRQTLQDCGIIGITVQLLEHGGVRKVSVAAGKVFNQAVQTGVDFAEPAPVVDAVGNVLEFPGFHIAGVPEHVVAQDVGVQRADAVDRHTARDAEIGHPDFAVPDNGHILGLIGIMIKCLDFLLPAAGNLLNNLVNPGQAAFHQGLGPAFQSLGENGMVGVRHGLGGNAPRFVPIHAGIIDKNPHQLGNDQRRMGIVDLNDVLLMEVLQRPVSVQMLGGNGLNGSRNQEILLFQPERLPLHMIVFGIEDLSDCLGHSLFLHGLEVLAPAKEVHINRLGRAGVPEPEDVHMIRPVTGDLHIIGHGLHHGSVLVDGMQIPVGPELPDRAAEGDLLCLGGLGEQPGSAQVLPMVGELHLLALHDFLLEQTQLVADRVAGSGNLQGGHGIQIASRQPSKTAVAQRRVRFHLEDIPRLESQRFQCLLELREHPKVICVLHQAPAHQEFHGQVMHLLLFALTGLLPGLHFTPGHHIPENQRAGPHHLAVRRLLGSLAEIRHQLRSQRFLQSFCCKCCCHCV